MWCWGHPVSWGLVTKPSPLVISTILLLQLSWLKMPNPTEIRALSHAAVQEKSVEMLMWSSMQEPREWEGSTGLSAWEQSGLQGSLQHGWTWHPGPLKHWALCHGPLHRLCTDNFQRKVSKLQKSSPFLFHPAEPPPGKEKTLNVSSFLQPLLDSVLPKRSGCPWARSTLLAPMFPDLH